MQARCRQRADAGRGAEQAESPGIGMEHVAGEHRQQREHAAQHHGEQIERDDAEHDRVVPHVEEAREQHRKAQRLARGGGALGFDVADQDARGDVERRAQRVDQDRAHRVEQPACRRPADHRDLRRRGAGRGGAGQQRHRHDARQQRGERGLLEGAGRAGDEHDGQQRFPRHPAARGAERQRRAGKPGDELADADDAAAVVAVGDMARHQHEQRGRHKLGQSDQPEVERIAGQVVHLPGHRHRLHLQGYGAGNAGHPIERERDDAAGAACWNRPSMLCRRLGHVSTFFRRSE